MGGQARTGRLVQDQSATKKDNGGGVGGHRRVAPKLAILTHTQLRWANNPCSWPPPRRRLRELELGWRRLLKLACRWN